VIHGLKCGCKVKPERLGGTQIPYSVGGELWCHPHLLVFFMCCMSPTFMLGIWNRGDWL